MITITTVLFAIIGMLISSLIKLARLKKQIKNFSFRYWLRNNWMENVTTLLMLFVLLYFMPNIATGMMHISVPKDSQFYEMLALGFGINTHSVFHDLIKSMKQ